MKSNADTIVIERVESLKSFRDTHEVKVPKSFERTTYVPPRAKNGFGRLAGTTERVRDETALAVEALSKHIPHHSNPIRSKEFGTAQVEKAAENKRRIEIVKAHKDIAQESVGISTYRPYNVQFGPGKNDYYSVIVPVKTVVTESIGNAVIYKTVLQPSKPGNRLIVMSDYSDVTAPQRVVLEVTFDEMTKLEETIQRIESMLNPENSLRQFATNRLAQILPEGPMKNMMIRKSPIQIDIIPSDVESRVTVANTSENALDSVEYAISAGFLDSTTFEKHQATLATSIRQKKIQGMYWGVYTNQKNEEIYCADYAISMSGANQVLNAVDRAYHAWRES